MRTRITLLFVAAVLGLLPASRVWAALLYDNGPVNGTVNAWIIGTPFNFMVSDSFTLSGTSTLTEAQVGLWTYPGYVPGSVSWELGTTQFDSSLGAGTGSLSNTFQFTNGFGYDIYESTFPLSGTLSAGTYWLTLVDLQDQNNTGNLMLWDQNSGPSAAFASVAGPIPSESFQIYGTSAVPEPSTLLLLGSGMTGLVAMRRFGFKKI